MSRDINVGAISEALNSKVDINCNNIDNQGEKRFDGQWISKILALSTATAMGTYNLDLSNYLPNDNYLYEISLNINCSSSSDTSVLTISSSVLPSGSTGAAESYYTIMCNASSTYGLNRFNLPIGNDKILTVIISGNSFSKRCIITALGYRRLGTNV